MESRATATGPVCARKQHGATAKPRAALQLSLVMGVAAQESAHGIRLHKRVIGTAEDSLGIVQGVNFVGTGLLADVKVLQQPIALGMQVRDHLGIREELTNGDLDSLFESLE